MSKSKFDPELHEAMMKNNMPSEMGRPTVMTNLVLSKLESAFMMGATDMQACIVANISTTALYDYQKENPDYTDRKAYLKDQPNILAKMVVLGAIQDGDKNQANWLLERRDKDYVKKQENKNETEIKGTIDFKSLTDDELREQL